MTKLDRLSERIRSIPDIDKEKGRLILVKTVKTEISNVVDGLVAVIEQAPNINALVKGGLIEALKEELSSADKQSRLLRKLIQRDNFGAEQKISEHIDNLKRIKVILETKRNREWDKIKDKAKTVEIILGIAIKLNLDSVASLRVAASSFKAVTAFPPSSSADVEKVQAVISGCETTIANSGLKGNVKTLLEAAIDDRGDPKLLLDNEVQQFFNDHPNLWEVFKLRMV